MLLKEVANTVPDGLLKATWYLKLGEATFIAGVMAFEDQEFDECHRFMADCHEPFEEAVKHGKDDVQICEAVYDYQSRVYIHLCIVESVSLRTQAENLYRTHLLNQESVNFDLMWDVADMFKHCTMLLREQDVEQEAIGLSRLGKIFDVVLKLPDKAKGYYKRSFQLATALFPRTFNTMQGLVQRLQPGCRKVPKGSSSKRRIQLARKEEAIFRRAEARIGCPGGSSC